MRSKELVLKVYRKAVVPVFRCDIRRRMPLIMSGVVDENLDWPEAFPDPDNGSLQGADISEIRVFETAR